MTFKNPNQVFEYIMDISNVFTNQYGRKMGRSLHMTGAAATVSTFIATGKLIMGILSLSLFTCANALYSFGMIGAKIIALTGIRKAQDKREQNQYYFWTGAVLIVSSLVYIIYSIHLFITPITSSFHMYVGIGIAAVTFTEIGVNIRGVIITRRDHTILINAIKMINLSASLITLVLTQTALLSFTNKESDLLGMSKANGMIGLLMGTAATTIGIYMVYRAKKIKTQDNL